MASFRSRLATRILAVEEYRRWEEFLCSAPGGTIYSFPAYLDALCGATGGRFQVVAVEKGDDLVGGCALYTEIQKWGSVASNRLLLYFHPIVLRQYDTQYPSERTARRLAVLDQVEAWLRRQSFDRLVLHCRHLHDVRPFQAAGWQASPSYTYEMLFEDLEAAYGRIAQNLRRLIRRAEREGLTLTEDGDFDSFFRLHRLVHERKGAPLYLSEKPFRRFVRILRKGRLARLYHVRLPSGRSVAAQLVLTGPFPMTHTVCAGADEQYLAIGSTPFLRWKVCEDLHRRGIFGNDLTDAALNEVTRFKSQLGGALRQNFVLRRPDSARCLRHERYRALRTKLGGAVKRLLGR